MDPQAVDEIVQSSLPLEAAGNASAPALLSITAGIREMQLQMLGVVKRLPHLQ